MKDAQKPDHEVTRKEREAAILWFKQVLRK